MDSRRLGRTGLVVSALGLGTMTWGRDTDVDDASEQLRRFRDAGGTLVDTANRYAGGESERMIGHLLQQEVGREEVVLATKAGSPMGPGPMDTGASRGHLLSALDASLRRLGTDHVDLWQVHAWDDGTPLDETLSALDQAVQSGRARYVGVSNFSGWQTAAAATWQLARPGRTPLASTQVEYSLLQRGIEREVLPACADTGLGVLAWSPLGRGVLTGKYRHGIPGDARGAVPAYQPFVARYLNDASSAVVDAVVTAADGLGVAPAAVALAWVLGRAGVSSAIVGARTAGQLEGSLAALELELPAEIRAALDDVSAPVLGYPEA